MINEASQVEKKIDALEAEELAIENKATHQGYRDASRRNRIQEEIGALHDVERRDDSSRARP